MEHRRPLPPGPDVDDGVAVQIPDEGRDVVAHHRAEAARGGVLLLRHVVHGPVLRPAPERALGEGEVQRGEGLRELRLPGHPHCACARSGGRQGGALCHKPAQCVGGEEKAQRGDCLGEGESYLRREPLHPCTRSPGTGRRRAPSPRPTSG